jgi:hypothetical protein
LHPTTAKDNAAKKNREKMTANTFFIVYLLLSGMGN